MQSTRYAFPSWYDTLSTCEPSSDRPQATKILTNIFEIEYESRRGEKMKKQIHVLVSCHVFYEAQRQARRGKFIYYRYLGSSGRRKIMKSCLRFLSMKSYERDKKYQVKI